MRTTERILQIGAQTISIVFNPLVVPSLGTIMIFRSGNYFSLWPSGTVAWIVFIVSMGTLWLPLVILQLLRHMQYLSDLRLDGQKERILPYSLILIAYMVTYFFLRQLSVPDVVENIVLSACIGLAINIILLFYWKISSHAIGAGGLLALTLLLFLRWQACNFMLLYFTILMVGLVCSARLWLKAHTEKQVYAGLFLGFLLTAFILIGT